ncbi:hypothetical protein BJF81_08505 [Ornithinimicrobium sp. CNJ-824]|uniref:glycosyltransferase family 2 protein n=1 Tax=Ornithinimicrobium sp. CNJ-824 TaxID=1904966 RepID=UPI00095A2E87|nr:glycosyltransferase family 2 protein [Ornithinimicrobium sp. CNJ-824]OLT19552.1 hypothetical protein BJF81_08505 [Ornithinimicrobium sp. CNJ-824]
MNLPLDAGRPGLWTAVSLVGPARNRPVAVAHLGLRTRSTVVADALSLAATRGCSVEDLARLIDEDVDRLDAVVTDDAALAGLALLWAGQGDPACADRGALLYGWLAASGRLPELPVHHQATAQALLLSGRARELRDLLPILTRIPAPVRHDVEVDLTRPGPGDPPGGERWLAWERLLSARFTDRGLVPVRVRAEGPEPHLFDRLTAAAPQGPGGKILVTVVVPCWRPDEGLLSSVASLTAQSYPDLEIVVVDDASGPGYEHLFDAVLRSDDRVTLLRLQANGGSYLARRAALEVARGSVFTTQDADDWSHPQRIEHQLRTLEEHPSAPASRSLAVRAKDDLTHQWFGYRAVRDNASSLMVRRDVEERAGTFLPLRKSADSEYAERLQVLVGPVVDTGSPLAVTRLRAAASAGGTSPSSGPTPTASPSGGPTAPGTGAWVIVPTGPRPTRTCPRFRLPSSEVFRTHRSDRRPSSWRSWATSLLLRVARRRMRASCSPGGVAVAPWRCGTSSAPPRPHRPARRCIPPGTTWSSSWTTCTCSPGHGPCARGPSSCWSRRP